MDQPIIVPLKSKLKSSLENLNRKSSITCTKVPHVLFDKEVADTHFKKFGAVQRMWFLSKQQVIIVEYDDVQSAERAVLNAGAYDGFMFDVTRKRPKVVTKSKKDDEQRSKKDDDPDWVPDEDVEKELSAMSGLPVYRLSRQKPMELDTPPKLMKEVKQPVKRIPSTPMKTKIKPIITQPASGQDSPVTVVTVATSLNTVEAAEQLHQLRSKVSLSPDEQWRTLDARDRILRSWGGAGSRVKVGGATIGTCPDMCPEKERLHRQAEHQVMTLETVLDSDGRLEPMWAIKQYSRSSADQEMPMCYELRPPRVLLCAADHLRQIADTQRQVSLADWFHFMWDRFRSIRKDITQQALCCADSIRLVEMCARFHAHCGARLADLEHTQFDQKLNTDNLTKCLQTLKHMYADVSTELKPREAEFRGYVALLNLGDANFWWEIKQLPQDIQKSRSIVFALNVFLALDNNNYVKFFRLVRHEATYLQACILLRYFNDVRARALARIVKAYAPRGGYLYPAKNIMENLAFENIESMKSFIDHYGLRCAKNTEEVSIVLNRTQFIEDSDPFPISRAINLIESKRTTSVGDVISGGKLPPFDPATHNLYSSFSSNGKLKETALLAEDLGYDTKNDTNKDINLLKAELTKLAKGNLNSTVVEKTIEPQNVLGKNLFGSSARNIPNVLIDPGKENKEVHRFSFHPATPIASNEELKSSKENIFGINKKNLFTFSKPQEMEKNTVSKNLFANSLSAPTTVADPQIVDSKNIFSNSNKFISKDLKVTQNLFKNSAAAKSIFAVGDNNIDTKSGNKNVFASESIKAPATKNLFSKGDSGGLFTKSQGATGSITNIFTKPQGEHSKNPTTIFGAFKGPTQNINGDGGSTAISPGSLFKSVNQNPQFPPTTKYNIFQSKNRAPTVADNISGSVNIPNSNIYDLDQKSNELFDRPFDQQKDEEIRILKDKAKKEEMEMMLEIQRKIEEKRRQEEQKRKQEEQKRIEELKSLEERRMQERKQEELKRKLEEERLAKEKKKAEEKRKAEEKEKRFKERVDSESIDLLTELQINITDETVRVILKEEMELKNKLFLYAEEVSNEISLELVKEICISELKAEIFRRNKLMAKWFSIWRKHYFRNCKRRSLLEDTPVWLPDKTPQQEANFLRRPTESYSLRHMNAVHKGYKFVVDLNEIPPPVRFNLVDIIRSPFLKRMKDIQYPYDKCFFWKLTIISPGLTKWVYRRINIEKWISDAFGDQKEYNISKSLLYVGKESWNNLMDFAISISMISKEKSSCASEALEGTNGILHYLTDSKDIELLEGAINYKYVYQVIPLAVIITEPISIKALEDLLHMYKNKNMISDFKLFHLESANLAESINVCTKRALKWIAKKYPRPPSLEIDYLKSICQRYLGNEIWCNLKYETRNMKNLLKLISCYNSAVDKLTEVITDEDLFNYASFPLEFKKYLNDMSPYPKPYEFISSNTRNSDNVCAIKNIMARLRLPMVSFNPLPGSNVQDQIQRYCQQIGWFEKPDEVACKVIALLPSEVSIAMPYEEFSENYQNYDLIDILNVIVYEKIKELQNFDNRFAIYLKPVLDNYRNLNWLLNMDTFSIENYDLTYEDDIDFYIDSKRRKIAIDSMEYIMLEDKDCTIVDENLEKVESNIKTYSECEESVLKLEQQLHDEKKKSEALEYLLRSALSDV